MKFQFRLSEQRDGDIIYWLNHTEDKSEAIRSAIRAAIEKEKAINEMLEAMSRIDDHDTELKKAIKDTHWTCQHYKGCNTLDDVKRFIGWLYPGEKKSLLDEAWKEMYPDE